MAATARQFICLPCRRRLALPLLTRRGPANAALSSETPSSTSTPSIAPKVQLNLHHIRQHPALHAQNCVDRNYKELAGIPQQIYDIHQRLKYLDHASRDSRQRINELQQIVKERSSSKVKDGLEEVIGELKSLKAQMSSSEAEEKLLKAETAHLALQLPNLTSHSTPVDHEPELLGHINPQLKPDLSKTASTPSHVDIGKELELLDFAAASTTSGWGWYYLLNEAAMLEQALVQYALETARKRGWKVVTPPSIVYSHIGAACGFQPRDQNGEQQVYALERSEKDARKPQHSLAGTAEIALAAMKANATFEESELPLKVVGVSRSYRAEAGARGAETKGLYRVHEFTKVELFAWALPSALGDDNSPSLQIFEEMLDIQKEILTNLGLHCRILEMPASDLGASASRKVDIEAYFPSRQERTEGWGEVTSASICTDYQSRRLATKVRRREGGGGTEFAHTLNGTAMAIPRIIMALLENGWEEQHRRVRIPEVLQRWMGSEYISRSPAQ